MRIYVFLLGLGTVSGTKTIYLILHFQESLTAVLDSTKNALLLSAAFPQVQGIAGRGVYRSITT